jgi:iron complex outermembrane recepter protein
MKIFLSTFLLFCAVHVFAQTKVNGVVMDALTGETLIGANIVFGEGRGTSADNDGKFTVSLAPGSYTFVVSFVGYESISRTVEVKSRELFLEFKMRTTILGEVDVVADIAIDRETPIAFSNVEPKQIQRELASQDLPMVLNSTPGIYATQQGGGDGDARINIRGFSQRNIAVMIDGVPVNDMENGWVYWSNWFGLDAITQKMQVQRGLGASKLAIPSVGGTLNILSKGIDQKGYTRIKQETGSNGFLRTSVGYNTGRLKGDWGVTFAGSYKRGDGWVDQTWTKGWFYYLKVEKKLGNHMLSLSGFGAPQSHGQRSFKINIADHDKEYARGLFEGSPELYDLMAQYNRGQIDQNELNQGLTTLGLTQDDYNSALTNFVDTMNGKDYGIRYNQHWGYLDRFNIVNGDTVFNGQEALNERVNYYHKPQFSLRDFWTVNDRLYISNVAYMSIGNGGGTRLTKANPARDENGQILFQTMYNSNKFGPFSVDPVYSDTERKSSDYIQSSINNHMWYGLISTVTFNQNKELTHSGGLDLRAYRGEHYRTVYDLLGGDYAVENSNLNSPTAMKREGDTISYNNDALVRWAGGFYQLEYNKGLFASFINISFANTGYKRIDYFRKKDLVLADTTYVEAIGYNDTLVVDGVSYNTNSAEVRFTETDWSNHQSFTLKTGGKYDLNERNSVYVNLGYISRAPRFQNVFYFDNTKFRDIKNEQVKALELGYKYGSSLFSANVNAYYTRWENRPVNNGVVLVVDDQVVRANINNMDAVHMGIEVDFAYRINKELTLQGLISLGDWRWASQDTARFVDDDNNPIINPSTGEPMNVWFDARNVHVGDAAQTQFGASLQYEPIDNLYFTGRITHFRRYYAEFDPITLTGANAQRDSWKAPAYSIVDIHAGYRLRFKDQSLAFTASLLNALDAIYITDAQNNDSFSTSTADFNANSAGVFFGMGRRFNLSISYEF